MSSKPEQKGRESTDDETVNIPIATFTIPNGYVNICFTNDPPKTFCDRYSKYKTSELMYLLPDESFSRMPHEVVFQHIFPGVKSDERLSKIHRLNEPSDYLTPDKIEICGQLALVHELKTCYYDDMVQGKIREIQDVYEPEIRRRADAAGLSYELHHVVVTRNICRCSDATLDTDGSTELFRWCSTLKSLATQSGWVYEKNESYSEDQRQMLADLKRLSIKEKDSLPMISKENIRDWMGRHPKQVMTTAKREFLSASQDAHKIIVSNLAKQRKPLDLLKEYDHKCAEIISKYWKEHDEHPNSNRCDAKAVVQLPLFVCRLDSESKTTAQKVIELGKLRITSDRAHSRLWISCIDWASKNIEESFLDLPKEEDGRPSVLDDTFIKTRRRKHYRVKPSMKEDDKVKLATVGIESRKYREDSVVQSVISEKSKGFLSKSPVDDIDRFVQKFRLRSMGGKFEPMFSDISDLYERALEVMNEESIYNKFSDDSRQYFDSFNDTNLGVSLEILENIVQEVNISRQQYCNAGEFILKTLPGYNIYLLIKSTSPNAQIFFSVLVKKEDMIEKFDLPFKTMHDFGDVYISEFVSLNQHSCTHYLYIREKACSLLAMWMSLHSQYLTEDLSSVSDDCMSHFNASLLFWLEGKEQTSKEVQQVRYAYMDCVMDNFINHFPLKILSKWEPFSRSRLCIWMRKRTMNCLMNMKPGVRYTSVDEFDLSEFDKTLDKDCSIISWVTGKPVGRFEIALNLSYFGVLHNKEDSKEMHGFLKIFQKVISEELKMREARPDSMGVESLTRTQLGSHEFNSDFVCAIGDTLLGRIEKKHPEPKSWIMNRAMDRLLSRDVEKLATMKKSATGELWREEHIRDSKENERVTCLEASIKLMAGGYDYKVMKQVGKMAREVQAEYGGIVSNLFKKLQIGGVREIFVLEFRCRIIVHFVETICRSICDELDNEMLTKGDKKLGRTDAHFSVLISKLRQSRTSATVINSDDATTWAQRFVMPVFGCFLSRLLPDELIEPVMFVLNLVTSKKLELPHQLLDLYDKNPEITGFDPGMEELKAQYMGLSKHSDLLNPRSRMLKNRSNMMQGILHYTSSLLHSGYLYLWEDLATETLSRQMRNMYSLRLSEFDIVCTTKVSSDDSSCILSVAVEREPEEASEKQRLQITSRNLRVMMSVFTEAKAALYPLFASKQSVEKSSTSSHSNVEEFNSLWYYKNTLLTPVIKFVAASIKTHPNSKLDDRYHTYANLRNNLFEHGGSTMLCNVCQMGQMSAHYKTLGLRTNKMWPEYKLLLRENPHPSIGFFLLEHPLCTGMFGYDMAVYMACSDRRFRQIHLGLYRDENFEFTEEGRPTVRTYISFGQSAKYYAFKKQLQINDLEIKSYISDNLVNLYRETSTTHDSMMKLKIQASNPALSESMAFQTDSKLHAASAYILQDSVILQSKGMMGAHHTHKTFFDIARGFSDKDENDFKWLFPFNNFYDSVLRTLKDYKTSSLGAYVNRRSVSSKLDISTDSALQSVSLFQVLQRLWFNIPDVKGTKFTHEMVFKHYSSKFAWLSKTVNETLERSPFSDHLSLRNFLVSVSAKKKTVRTYAPSNAVSSPIDIVRSMIENCQWRGRKLNYVSVKRVLDAQSSMKMLTERIWRCLRAPLVQNKAELIEEILSRNVDPFASAQMSRDMYELSQSQIALSILIKFSKLQKESSSLHVLIPALIERFRLGVIGYFSRRQQLQGPSYVGPAVYTGLFEGCRVEISALDDCVTGIVCRNEVELNKCSHTVQDFIRDLGWHLLHKPGSQGMKYWDFAAQRMVRTKHARSVKVTFKDLKNLPEMKGDNMKIEVTDYNTIRLVNVESKRSYTILSYRIRTRDLGDNDTHAPADMEDNSHVSKWLRSDKARVDAIEKLILCDKSYESWACDTLRRRLMGLNRLPNLDSLFELDPDGPTTNDDSDSDTSSFMRAAAQEMLTVEDLEAFSAMFGNDQDSSDEGSSSGNGHETERLKLEEFEGSHFQDMSWLDYVKMPFKPGIAIDSAVTNKYFDDFIDKYTEVFGKRFLNYFVTKPDNLVSLVNSKIKREAEDIVIFKLKDYDEIV